MYLCVYLKFIYYNWGIVTLQYCGGFCHILTLNQPQVHMWPHPEPALTSLPTPPLWVVPEHCMGVFFNTKGEKG